LYLSAIVINLGQWHGATVHRLFAQSCCRS